MKPPFLIHTEQLSQSYRQGGEIIHALHKVDLTIKKGEMAAIMGPSGSGKSTLLHLLGCLGHPTSGLYRFNGHAINALEDKELSSIRATEIGFVFQSFNLIPQLTVFENIKAPFSTSPACSLNGKWKRGSLPQRHLSKWIID